MAMRNRASERGLTLIEVLISISVLALVGSLIYGAYDGMARTRKGLSGINDRYHQGRTAMGRMAREIQSAFISVNGQNVLNPVMQVRQTAFVAADEGDMDRLDFTTFAHRRTLQNAHESDQCEVGYFVERNPDTGLMDLLRREDKYLDMEPTKGGVVNILAEDVKSFDIQYFDDVMNEWVDTWNTLNATGQPARLPKQVRITLILNGPNDKPIAFRERVDIPMQAVLNFMQ